MYAIQLVPYCFKCFLMIRINEGKARERETWASGDFSPKSKKGTLFRRVVELNAVSISILEAPSRA